MHKDYKDWNRLKGKINNSASGTVWFHEREIWYCSLGQNVGFEQDGKGKDFLRPVIILKKFNNRLFWAIPLTSVNKKHKYYLAVSFTSSKTGFAILSQIRLIDAKRLFHKLGFLSVDQFSLLREKLRELIP